MPVKQTIIFTLMLVSVVALSAALIWQDAIPIRQGVNIEWFRTGTETTDGGAIYVWSDTKLGERDLWAQKVDAAGNMVWGDPVLIDGKADRQEDPVITKTSDGNYIIAWIDFFDDPDGNVYAQKINNQGQLLWPAGGKPVCTTYGVQIGLNMEADNAGGAFIIWGDSRNPSKDLYGQRLSSTGDPLWIENGIPIANGPGDEVQNTMLPDGQGGMMIGYTHTHLGQSDVYVKHFNANSVMTWANPLELAVAPLNQYGVRMAALDAGEFVFTWTDNRTGDNDIYAQKINIAGQILWADPYIVFSDASATPPVSQLNPRIVKTSDNAVVIVWEDHRLDLQNPDLFAQKISAAGTKLWDAAGIAVTTAEFAQYGQRMAADDNGGCYVVWDDLRNGNSPNDDIYAQHLSSTGSALWTPGGKPICTMPNEQNGGLVKVSNGNIYINWMDLRNGSVGIYYQVLNSAGNTQLPENGQLVFWGLSGDTPKDQFQILNRAEDTVVIWQDTRYANDGYRIFFQFVNPNGSVDLETNGRPVTLQGGGRQENPRAVVTPDGHIAVVWIDSRNDDPNIYAQLLSPTGERLWGDNGIKVTSSDALSQLDAKISYYNDSFYIGWSNWDIVSGDFYYHVYGQRIQNGQKMWGPDGIIISQLAANELNNECVLTDLIDDFYVWHRVDPSTQANTIWVKRVDASGNAATGWPSNGLKASTYEGFPIRQIHPKAHPTPEGIVVMWRDLRGDFIMSFWGQHISRQGERLWDPLGVSISERGNEQEIPAIATTRNGITFAWCESIAGMHDIAVQKFSFPGVPLWPNQGYYVVQKDSSQVNPTLASFPGNGMLIAWTEYLAIESDIYYKYINADGSMVGDLGGNILCDASKAQYAPLAVSIGNDAYVVWADGRSSGKTEILGLYAQRLNNESVANQDPVSPPILKMDLQQNYPNPFNPSTNIMLTMPVAAELNLNIYNTKGQLVRNLHSGNVAQGTHSFTWNGKDDKGNTVASGIYFYTATSGNQTQTRKMLMMK